MLKYLFTIIILAQIAYGRFTLEDRSGGGESSIEGCNAEFISEYECDKLCHVDKDMCICKNVTYKCEEHGKKFCRYDAPYQGHVYCPLDEICVEKDCECQPPGLEKCDPLCDKTCKYDEVKCDGGTGSDGCKENDYCEKVCNDEDGNPCQNGFCPVVCDDDEYKCDMPPLPNGCCTKPICIKKPITTGGDFCQHHHCPKTCELSEQKCAAIVDHVGCPGAEICIPKCSESCPVQCLDEQIKCVGPINCDSGCKEPDICVERHLDCNGNSCPDDSHSHGCPATCCVTYNKPNTTLCPPDDAVPDSLGCLEAPQCVPYTCDDEGHQCPKPTDCPKTCPGNHVKCEVKEDDVNGCGLPDVCVEQQSDDDGSLCAVHCPKVCEDDEVLCKGHISANGCPQEDVCIPRHTQSRGDCPGKPCPGYCVPQCAHNEILCPSQINPCDGCPTEQVCREIVTNVNSEACAGAVPYLEPYLSASHNCEKLCDELYGEVLCPAIQYPDGCKGPAECYQRTNSTVDGHFCPAHSVCPVYCNEDQVKCLQGSDERGCKNQCICVDKGLDGDKNVCNVGNEICPPICDAGEILVPDGYEINECPKRRKCVPAN